MNKFLLNPNKNFELPVSLPTMFYFLQKFNFSPPLGLIRLRRHCVYSASL